ncbi:MAG TPA: alpha/beta hydrolase [Candidatus Baltobacteraceae bacterium]|nr:alpha/beta hydrolase [Candidatus Baltobacteraceae bacterium]
MLVFIDNAGVQLCMERRGSGPRQVLMLHGWISARRMWYGVADRLDPNQFTLHLLDFRGNGLSDRPEHGHDLHGYVSDARAALASIDGPVLLAGHSMGGKVAQFLASERPENLEKLLLAAPGTASGGRPSERHRAAALRSFGSRAKIEAFQRAAMARTLEPAVMQRIVDDALVSQREHWHGWYDNGRFAEFTDRLKRICVPTLCIGGAKDPLVPPSRLRRDVSALISGCLLVTLREAGHNLPVEAPDEIAQAITSF